MALQNACLANSIYIGKRTSYMQSDSSQNHDMFPEKLQKYIWMRWLMQPILVQDYKVRAKEENVRMSQENGIAFTHEITNHQSCSIPHDRSKSAAED